ncbi:sensor histidine kinase [Terriglobus tenax]|uniref:sensor histidine kinase n=1 Tax=Terriglobus tenax TaxID=1111115 RepID=UPI0021E099EE|nr:ATP-binding protein [Terriglobus tenax]
MKRFTPTNLRSRLTSWYVAVLALLLLVYATIVFAFQYAVLTRQMLHDEIQDVVTVEGLLYFDSFGKLQLRQDYFSRPQSHLLVDRYMEVRDRADNVLFSSPTLHGMRLGGPSYQGEGDRDFAERIVRLDDGSHVFVVSHVHGMDDRTLLIRLGYSLAPLRDRMWQFLLLLLIAIPVALALAAIAGQTIAKRALRPVDDMTDRATQITATNLHDRLLIANPDDELGRMATAFNHLLSRLEAAFQQLGRFTSDAAHELRTPLASIRTMGEVALSREMDANSRRVVEDILEETSRLSGTVDSLLLLSRVEATGATGQFEKFQLCDLLNEITALLALMMEESRVSLELSCDTNIFVQADRSLMRVALLNVTHNAWKFSPSDSTIRVVCRRVESSAMAEVVIEDEGEGLSPEDREKVFERFYTGTATSQSQKGAGLGLSISKLVVERFGGSIEFNSEYKSGARCVIHLPALK